MIICIAFVFILRSLASDRVETGASAFDNSACSAGRTAPPPGGPAPGPAAEADETAEPGPYYYFPFYSYPYS